MSESIILYKLNWCGASISDSKNDGLWINRNKIAIHLPIFRRNFLNEHKNKTNTKKNKNKNKNKTKTNCFYICYDDDNDDISEMKFSYFGLNDIVFTDSAYNYCKKANVYTSIKPYYINEG